MSRIKLLSLLPIVCALFAVTSITGCKEDACKGVTCQNGGKCNNGDCACEFAYEGKNCETLKRTKFFGTYEGTITVAPYPAMAATIDVTAGADSLSQMTMTITNTVLNGSGKAVAIGGNNLTIPLQMINSFEISGSGRLDGSVMYDTLTITGVGTGYFQGVRQ